jgi:uncharacterized membrane protein YfcA
MLVLAAALSLLIGLSLGLLGGGGAILTTPILVYVLELDAKEAIASALLVVGVTSAVSTVAHARAGNVVWRTGLIFGISGMVGAYAGGSTAHYVRGTVLLVAFAAMMLVTALAMIRGRRASSGDGHMHPTKAIAAGVAVGVVAGLVGAGGGFLIVPALILFGGVPMLRAVGTSLFVITLQSFAGFAGHITHTRVQGSLLAVIIAAAVVGTLAGAKLAQRIHADALRRGFAWFVLAMGLFVTARELPLLVAAPIAVVAFGIAATVSWRAARARAPDAT